MTAFYDLPDSHRRAAANLSVPRTVSNLHRFLLRHDAPNLPGAFNEERLTEILTELAAAGLIKNVGQHGDPKAALSAVQKDKEVVSLPKEKAANYLQVAANPAKQTLTVDGELWVLTQAGHDALAKGED